MVLTKRWTNEAEFIFQRHAKELESRLAVKDAEINELRQRLLKNGTIPATDSSG